MSEHLVDEKLNRDEESDDDNDVLQDLKNASADFLDYELVPRGELLIQVDSFGNYS